MLTGQFRKKMQDYYNFIRKYHGKKLVILEFGVGWRNRMIKEPLMQLTAAEPHSAYITFNKGEIYIPNEIADRSIGADGDIAAALCKCQFLFSLYHLINLSEQGYLNNHRPV